MPGVFFTSWALWQEMTFVLAMSIVAVFCAGLGKLWWNNRLLKKQEVLDVEKRARVEELRKTGLPMKRANQVPFGVRAIQSGIEVDGIWISRPASLNELGEKLASSTTLAGRDSDSQKKGRYYSGDAKSLLVTTTSLDHAGPKQSSSTASIFQKLTDTDSVGSAQSSAPPVSQFAYKAKRQSSRPAGTLNEDTLRRLEGQPPLKPPHYETYVPTSSSRQNPRGPSLRSSASSSAESVDSQPRSAKSVSYASSSHSSRLYMARNPHAAASSSSPSRRAAGHDASPLRRWSEKEGEARDPFETPARTPSGFSALSRAQSEARGPSSVQQAGLEMAGPEPALGTGELRFDR